MGLPWSLPAYIKHPTRAFKHALQIYGFGTDCFWGGMLVDNSHYLEGEVASCYFYLIPVDHTKPVPYSFGSFVADCLAFEHATPMQALPHERWLSLKDVPWCIKPKHRKDIPEMYLSDLTGSYENAARIAEGLWYHPVFRYDELLNAPTIVHNGSELVHLNFSATYGRVSQSLHLYNAGLRQTDPLAQFLNYYRIIEGLSRSNGKAWVENAIGAMPDYKINLYVRHGVGDRVGTTFKQTIEASARKHLRSDRLAGPRGLHNFSEVLRAYSVARLNELAVKLSNREIAKQLYNINRCGIAHGQDIRRHDIGLDLKEILGDLRLIRYLARVIIEEYM